MPTLQAIGKIITAVVNTAKETFWPTRCAVCDLPGFLLCPQCRFSLPYIDPSRACPRCGAPCGTYTCTECPAPGSVDHQGRQVPSPYLFAAARSVCSYEDGAAHLLKAYKDAGEVRLHTVIAQLLAQTIQGNPLAPEHGSAQDWSVWADALVPIPTSSAALKRRGFDHLGLIAQEVAQETGLPLLHPLAHSGKTLDQRSLGQQQRTQNLQTAFTLTAEAAPLPPHILLLDDVLTTGATTNSATKLLLTAGAREVNIVTFARVW